MVPYNNGSNWNFQNNRDPNEEFKNHFSTGRSVGFDRDSKEVLEDKEKVVMAIAKI